MDNKADQNSKAQEFQPRKVSQNTEFGFCSA
jgi:hypothetical protein